MTKKVPERVHEAVAAALVEIEAHLPHFSLTTRPAVEKALKMIDEAIS